MMNELLMLAASLGLVGLVVALVWFLKLGSPGIESDRHAAELAEAFYASFNAGAVLRDRQGGAALVADADGQGFVVMKQNGSRASGRFLTSPKIEARNGSWIVDSEDGWFGTVTIDPEDEALAGRMAALVEKSRSAR